MEGMITQDPGIGEFCDQGTHRQYNPGRIRPPDRSTQTVRFRGLHGPQSGMTMPIEPSKNELKGSWFTEACVESGSAFSLATTEKLHSEETEFQTIDIYATEHWGNLMVIDGCTMVSARDNFLYHEMMSHPALFTHAAARNVVIIGGGDCGTLKEVLKHAEVKRAIQIEIDERVTRLAEEYFPELTESNSDPRAEFVFDDGIQWMKDVEEESLDIIIVDSTDPIGPAEGLFDEPFYRACFRALRSGGIVVAQSESPLLHTDVISAMRSKLKGAGFNDVKTLTFPQPLYPSGWWSATMARKDAEFTGFRERGAANKPFDTQYYNVETHKAAFAMPEFLKAALGEE